MKLVNILRPTTVAITLALFGMNAYASDNVNINITGKVVASPCSTLPGDGSSLSVQLGDTIQAADLSAPASGSAMVPFDLALTGCPAGTSNVKATFSGTADTDPTLWKNTAGTPAANTAVEISEVTGGALVSNAGSLTVPVTAEAATFKLQARAFSVAGSVTPGDISSTVVVAFEYQ